ncbi:MAG: class I SAM-dependent methyltransferase, partial [Thermosynechococcaceae cyanobacterium]
LIRAVFMRYRGQHLVGANSRSPRPDVPLELAEAIAVRLTETLIKSINTMKRIPEPELMNEAEQARAYAEADFAEPHNRCIELLLHALAHLPQTGTAVDLGCGSGDVTIRLARALPEWSIMGLDGSPMMLHYAHQAVQREGLEKRIALQTVYLPDGATLGDRFDLVFSNSLLHHLANPMVLWQAVHQWAKPQAAIFIMDLMRPNCAETAAQLVNQYAAHEPEVLRRDFYNSLLAAYRIDEVKHQLQHVQLDYLEVKPASDRHFYVYGCLAQ